jgi:hypothetical protein
MRGGEVVEIGRKKAISPRHKPMAGFPPPGGGGDGSLRLPCPFTYAATPGRFLAKVCPYFGG